MKNLSVNLSGKTRIFGIVGWPVSHSLSPLMQNAAFTAMQIDAVYVPFPVREIDLRDAVTGLRVLSIQGFNVTIPHKQNIIPCLDRLSKEAQAIGAVNTVAREGDELVGHNSDSSGFLRSLQYDLGFSPRGHRIVVLGAGGAARACVYALCQAGAAEVVIANRNCERAIALSEEFGLICPSTKIHAFPLDNNALKEPCYAADLIVNTTSIGLDKMGSNAAGTFDLLPWGNINSETLLYDVVYSPGSTPLVKRARANGMVAKDGIGMLIAQGEEAFKIWTGHDPGDSMRCAVENVA
ncbi:MAG: shikimate dehydrogenase [Desulfuromonadaceae bacterium]|nr:shikimate dehydrogenase [Desulfuromonadaceae bacterium]